MAYIRDSVPEFVNRNMPRPKRVQNRSLISVAWGDGVTNSVPVSCSARSTCSTTTGLRWPTSIAPKPIERSSSWRPSTSVSQAPLADWMEIGYGSQYWNDDVTPSGSVSLARLFCVPEAAVDPVKRSHSAASSCSARPAATGVDFSGSHRWVPGSCAGQVVGVARSVMGDKVNLPGALEREQSVTVN